MNASQWILLLLAIASNMALYEIGDYIVSKELLPHRYTIEIRGEEPFGTSYKIKKVRK